MYRLWSSGLVSRRICGEFRGGFSVGYFFKFRGRQQARRDLDIAHDHTVAEDEVAFAVAGDVELVRDEHDRDSTFVQFLEYLHDFHTGTCIQVTRGFVGEYHDRVVDEGTRNGYSLLLTAGQRRGPSCSQPAELDQFALPVSTVAVSASSGLVCGPSTIISLE